ncbi:MAG: PSD1 and planctomycete cytochrome C domain-containing protein [Verrucomicrobia bacterium]|nr:PSD1 and planctomycete cytochrome C domain-containing protein [Verrucomicrobiota bacterium]
MHRLLVSLLLFPAWLAAAPTLPDDHAQRMERGLKLFQGEVAGLLKEHCLRCHGGEKVKSGLDMATREELLRGGAHGSVVVPFDAAGSVLVEQINHAKDPHMPDDRPKLSAGVIAKITAWINDGAPYAEPLVAGKKPKRDASVVTNEDRQWWSFLPLAKVKANSIDELLLKHAKGMNFNPPADKATLVRRLYLDLTGLPPPEGADAGDLTEIADKLLASPRYGERWARHWLDVARFAESTGFEQDYDRPFAFHYRDFVIKALNQDMPYDVFVKWQLAGDEYEPQNPLALAATGFLGAGVFPSQITANEVERTRYDAMDDMLSTTGGAMLGLTVGCARCHDHKFDPLPMRDYYQMLSTFTTTTRSNVDVWPDRVTSAVTVMAKDKSTPLQVGATRMMICGEGYEPIVMHTQGGPFFDKTFYLKRGSTDMKDGEAQQGFMQALSQPGEAKRWQWQPPAGAKYSGRRRTLSNWITDVDHGAGALLARVIVNRLWQHHFGTGLVATPNDFGKTGTPPTQPELLDWLAGKLIANGWQLKPLHRLMVNSQAYRQSTQRSVEKEAADPANALCMRRVPQRLEAEAIRDSLLAVSGTLDETMFGPGTRDENSKRRSIYFTIKRSLLMGSMVAFDLPEPLVSQGSRPTTTVAPQALILMNSPQARSWAEGLAKRIASAGDVKQQIVKAYTICFHRAPKAEELAQGLAFMQGGGSAADYCQVLLSLNEMVYVN